MNRHKNNRQRQLAEKRLKTLIRDLSCWNCFQFGHKRFQCPYPKQNRCSFCRKPYVLSVDCGCDLARQNFNVVKPQVVNVIPNYAENVIVPVRQLNGEVEYQQNDNILVIVGNENMNAENIKDGEDYLEINAETESLSDL